MVHYVTFPTKLISTKLCNALTSMTCNIFVRNQTDLGKFEIAIFILNYQLQFLFLCDQVLGGESFHNGLKSIATDHYCCCYTMHNIARVNTFLWETKCYTCKHFFQILLQDHGHLWTKFNECISMNLLYHYTFYWKLINSVKLGLKTCIMWYICKM